VVSSKAGSTRELATHIWTGADYPWSPDGAHLAVSVETGEGGDLTDLFVVDSDGKSLRRLTYGGHSANLSWSPDGRRFAFEWTLSVISGPSWIDISDANGAHIHGLTPKPLEGVADWSPTGKQLTVDTLTHGIYAIDADGSHLHRITSDVFSGFPIWSPDGRRVAFSQSTKLPTGDYGATCLSRMRTAAALGNSSEVTSTAARLHGRRAAS
jgi:Tol biopolymer transport system component